MAKSNLQKLNDPKKQPIVKPLPAGMSWGPEGAAMLISTPKEIEELVVQIPEGRVMAHPDIRAHLAQRHNAEITCPMTTTIFVNIIAGAAGEQEEMGASQNEVTPWWRVVKPDATLNEKAPGGVHEHKRRLEAEGHTFRPKGSKNFVLEWLDEKRWMPE